MAHLRINAPVTEDINFSFAGCGFLGIYHVGVASCLDTHARHLVEQCHFSGASAGAIISACLMCGVKLGDCTTFVISLATEARSHHVAGPFHPSFMISQTLEKALDRVLPANAHQIVSGRLHISVTRFSDYRNEIVSHYPTKRDLIQTLLCSAHVPLFSGLLPKVLNVPDEATDAGTETNMLKAVWSTLFHKTYFDGGLTVNIPIINEHTVTVSPFAGESDICPMDGDEMSTHHLMTANTSMQMSLSNLARLSRALLPPSLQELSDMCDQGFDDCLKYLQKHNLIRCPNHLQYTGAAPSARTTRTQGDIVLPRTDMTPGEGGRERCRDCKRRQQLALQGSLPKPVREVLVCAIKQDNRALNSMVSTCQPLRYLRKVFCLYMLPLEATVICSVRFLYYLPHLPGDFRSWIQNMTGQNRRDIEAAITRAHG